MSDEIIHTYFLQHLNSEFINDWEFIPVKYLNIIAGIDTSEISDYYCKYPDVDKNLMANCIVFNTMRKIKDGKITNLDIAFYDTPHEYKYYLYHVDDKIEDIVDYNKEDYYDIRINSRFFDNFRIACYTKSKVDVDVKIYEEYYLPRKTYKDYIDFIDKITQVIEDNSDHISPSSLAEGSVADDHLGSHFDDQQEYFE